MFKVLTRNGFRQRMFLLKSYPIFKQGFSLICVILFFALLGAKGVAGAGIKYAFAPLLKFDKDGLTGENLKFMESLQQRMKLEPDSKAKDEILKLIDDSKKEFIELATRLKDIDGDKVALLKELLGADDKGIRTILQKQGEMLKKLEEAGNKQQEDYSIRAQVIKWREANKDSLLKLKNGEKATLTALEVRLNSPMTPSNSLNGSAYIPRPEFEAGATEIVRPRLTFWDYLPKGRTSSAVYVWVNKKNPEGAAGWIGPGVAKPGVSLELASEISNAKKVAASEKVALELLEDVEGFASYIESELKFQVDKETNAKLMASAGSATIPKGIQNYSVTYTLAGVVTDNPNNWDAIRAVVAQLRSGNLDGAVTVFINPIDKANMDLTKLASQAQFYKPEMPDATIVEDNNIAVGYFQAAILSNYNVKIYKDYTVTYGWEMDDFTKNLVTLVGERRLHEYVKENHTGSFIYDTFANVKAAIAVG